MSRLDSSQKTVLLGIVGAGVVGWALFFGLRAILPEPDTVRVALAWLVLAPAVVIFVLVGSVGMRASSARASIRCRARIRASWW
jgi:hypothetical protein